MCSCKTLDLPCWDLLSDSVRLHPDLSNALQSERVFNGPTITVEDSRDYYGEQRFNTTGFFGTTIVTICHTETEDKIHVISMRKAESHEIDTLSHYL